jgi:hypothetical protein
VPEQFRSPGTIGVVDGHELEKKRGYEEGLQKKASKKDKGRQTRSSTNAPQRDEKLRLQTWTGYYNTDTVSKMVLISYTRM